MKSKQPTEVKVKNENFEFRFAIIKEPAEIKDLLTTLKWKLSRLII